MGEPSSREVWSREAVLALAPDAASVTAGTKLATAGSWSSDGCAGDALWGLCAGSGKNPYQSVVDLAGPAYKCSCPSRKFPCKHALALLLRWSAGRVPAAEEPADFAVTWLTTRAEKATREPAPARTPDPVAAASRAARRADRVAAGLAELDVWLTDQVRTGLAAASTAGYSYGAATAARMVDAQAPGLASALRRLPGTVVSGEGWTGRLLAELGQLRLLVAAHGRLEELPASDADTIRAHIGYPVRSEDVLARPAVRDTWVVTGVRDVLTDTLTARRVSLRGKESGRAALVLSFAPQGQSPDTSLVLGTDLDADLHFHPGNPPLRAVVGTRHTDAVTVHELPATSAVAAVEEFRTAVVADPWTRRWPVVIADLVPVVEGEEFHLVGAGGTLAVEPGGADLWRLLAVSGGFPVTVAGELSDRGLRPTAVLADGRVVGL